MWWYRLQCQWWCMERGQFSSVQNSIYALRKVPPPTPPYPSNELLAISEGSPMWPLSNWWLSFLAAPSVRGFPSVAFETVIMLIAIETVVMFIWLMIVLSHHLVSLRFPQCCLWNSYNAHCLWNSCNVHLIGDCPFSPPHLSEVSLVLPLKWW